MLSIRRFETVLVIFLAVSMLCMGVRPALAGKPVCGDGKCQGTEQANSCPEDCSSSGGGDDVIYQVQLVDGQDFAYQKPLYAPGCLAETFGGYSARFERHDLCATVVTDSGYLLTDDIAFDALTDQNGHIETFQLWGQDVIGKEGIIHHSVVVTFAPPVSPSDTGFVLHVHADNLAVWKLDKHKRGGKGAKRVEIVGYISIGDLVYTPKP